MHLQLLEKKERMRINDNHRTDHEFENFLENIGGLVDGYGTTNEPLLLRKQFPIGNGWLGILQRLIETLITLGWKKEFLTVKEKFGGMSLFLSNIPKNGFHFIIEAEKETHSVCEVCGEPGEKRKIRNWIYTLCENHGDEKLIIQNKGKTYLMRHLGGIKNGDLYYNANTHEVLKCETDNFFDPWSVRVIEFLKNDE